MAAGPPLGAPHGYHDGGGKKHSDQDDCEAKSLGMLRVFFLRAAARALARAAFERKAGLVGELGGIALAGLWRIADYSVISMR